MNASAYRSGCREVVDASRLSVTRWRSLLPAPLRCAPTRSAALRSALPGPAAIAAPRRCGHSGRLRQLLGRPCQRRPTRGPVREEELRAGTHSRAF